MGVVVHLNEVAQRDFVVSLSAGEDASEKLISCLGRRQGQSLPRTGNDLVEGIFMHNANLAAHIPLYSEVSQKSCLGRGG